MHASRLDELLATFPSLHLLVVGDFFLDKYLSIDPALSEESLETGLEAYQVVDIRHSPGAAGTVVANLRAMDVQVSVAGVVGRDGEGFDLREDLSDLGVNNVADLIEARDRFTPTYTKPMLRSGDPDQVEQELNRLDIKNRQPVPARYETAVIKACRRWLPQVDGVIIADQVQERNCGVITDRVREALVELARSYAQPFLVDSRMRIDQFARMMIKPNLQEAQTGVQRLNLVETDSLAAGDPIRLAEICGMALFQKNQKPVFVTLGAEGILVVTEAGSNHISGITVDGEIDIVGAGDSVMAGLAAGLAAGGTEKEAAFLGNLAASITVQQLGTTGTASRPQLRHQFRKIT